MTENMDRRGFMRVVAGAGAAAASGTGAEAAIRKEGRIEGKDVSAELLSRATQLQENAKKLRAFKQASVQQGAAAVPQLMDELAIKNDILRELNEMRELLGVKN